MCGDWKMREMERKCYDRSRNGGESEYPGAKKGPRDCRLDKANFLYFTLVG